MRTKALICAAIFAASVVASMAQVYSLNIVGYVNSKTVTTAEMTSGNFYLLVNPLDAKDNSISNVIKLDDTWDQTLCFPWVTNTGAYLDPPETYYAGFGWYPGTTPIPPGLGFFFLPKTNASVTFVGEVKTNQTTVLNPGFTLTGSPYPAAMRPLNLGLTGQDQDLIFRWNSTAQAYIDPPTTFYAGYGWFDASDPDTNGPVMSVAEGFFYNNVQSSAFNWAQSFAP